MRADGRRILALRIDVDFAVGLRDAVPFLLDSLAEAGMRATFFVVAGSNAPAQSLRRLARRGYLRRLRKLGISAIVRGLGASVIGPGAFLAGDRARAVLDRIAAEGHELAVHGHDHAWWADNAWVAADSRLVEEIELGYAAMRAAAGASALAWGSPSWRTTDAVLCHLRTRGVPYFAECWGTEPFLSPDRRGEPIPIPHLPITLPSPESLVLERGLDAHGVAAEIVDGRASGRVDVLCVHDYFEGMLRRDVFTALLGIIRDRDRETSTLRDAALALGSTCETLPVHRLTRAPVPGFLGEMSWQGTRVGDPIRRGAEIVIRA